MNTEEPVLAVSAVIEGVPSMAMPQFSVKIEGGPLFQAMTALNGAGLPTLGAGAHWGDAPPPDFDLTSLRAVFNAETADEAQRKVEAALPPDGSYQVNQAEQISAGA